MTYNQFMDCHQHLVDVLLADLQKHAMLFGKILKQSLACTFVMGLRSYEAHTGGVINDG